MAKDQPNILWYCTDQQRYDTLGCTGNPDIRTPVLDDLAGRATVFTHAYCQNPICTPSRATFLTGRYPASHHVYRNGNAYFPDHEVLVTRLLAEAGYDCGLIGKLHLAASQGAVERRTNDGYRMFAWSHHPYPDIPEGNQYTEWLRDKGVDPLGLYASLHGAYGPGVPVEYHQTTWCSERAIEFIRDKHDGPWLLSVNPFSPHPTFHPPPEFLERYDAQRMPYPLFRQRDLERQELFRQIDQQTVRAVDPRRVSGAADGADRSRDQLASLPPSSYDARMVRACYYADIEHVDYQLGRILEALEETGQRDNTVVIFMSDHGELLGDHGLIYKGCRFFEGLVRVPLLISAPAGQARACDALVELVDVAPTVLELAGLPVPAQMQGRSLRGILTGECPAEFHKPHVVCDYRDSLGPGTVSPDLAAYDASHGTMVFDGRYKLSLYHGHGIGELYDLDEDPGEFENLWGKPRWRTLREELLVKHMAAVLATAYGGPPRVREY